MKSKLKLSVCVNNKKKREKKRVDYFLSGGGVKV